MNKVFQDTFCHQSGVTSPLSVYDQADRSKTIELGLAEPGQSGSSTAISSNVRSGRTQNSLTVSKI